MFLIPMHAFLSFKISSPFPTLSCVVLFFLHKSLIHFSFAFKFRFRWHIVHTCDFIGEYFTIPWDAFHVPFSSASNTPKTMCSATVLNISQHLTQALGIWGLIYILRKNTYNINTHCSLIKYQSSQTSDIYKIWMLKWIRDSFTCAWLPSCLPVKFTAWTV